MFLPDESFLRAALEHDPSLTSSPSTNNVIPASPTNLIGLLRAVALRLAAGDDRGGRAADLRPRPRALQAALDDGRARLEARPVARRRRQVVQRDRRLARAAGAAPGAALRAARDHAASSRRARRRSSVRHGRSPQPSSSPRTTPRECSQASAARRVTRWNTRTRPDRFYLQGNIRHEELTIRTSVTDVRNVIIIGGGPAGYTAALYAARANLEPLVIEGFNWGGQLMITSRRRELPGLRRRRHGAGDDAGLPPPGRALRRRVRHRRRDARRLLGAAVPRLGRRRRVPRRHRDRRDGRQRAPARARVGAARCRAAASRTARPATPRSSATRSSSSSAAATPRSRRRPSSAASRARCTSSTAARSSAPRRSWSTAPARTRRSSSCSTRSSTRSSATARSTGVRLRDTVTGEESELETDGFFVAIGHDPNTALFLDQLDHEPETGYLVTGASRRRRTSRASSPPATSRTTSTARPSPPPAPGARPRSTRSGG